MEKECFNLNFRRERIVNIAYIENIKALCKYYVKLGVMTFSTSLLYVM